MIARRAVLAYKYRPCPVLPSAMKFIIERSKLLPSLAHVQSVVERRNTIPILSNVLLRAENGKLSLSATDMDLEIIESVPAEIAQPGATTAPAHTLYDIVRKLQDGSNVEFETSDSGVLAVRGGRSNFRLGCLPTDDFPQMAGSAMPVSFALGAADLRTLIDRARFAISTEETRYYLNGIYLHAAKSGEVPVLRAVATDGHRLARVEMPLPDGAADMPGVIVPRKTVAEVRKLLDDVTGQIQISLSDTKLRFAFDHVVLTSKLIDGTFPDYERVIPSGNDKVLEVNPREFAAAVDRVATIATEKTRAVKLSIDRGAMTVSANSPESGSATEELEIVYTANPLEIGFNSRYLLDITQQIEGDGCRLTIADAASPTIIRDTSDGSALYVLMPMRV
jgi:DNA polymerase-3 subunit beta